MDNDGQISKEDLIKVLNENWTDRNDSKQKNEEFVKVLMKNVDLNKNKSI
jgi:Ca2+-binding EF-hand superfamily protein